MIVPVDREVYSAPYSDRSDESDVDRDAAVWYNYPYVPGEGDTIGHACRMDAESRMTVSEEWGAMVVPASVEDADSVPESGAWGDRIWSSENSIMSDTPSSGVVEEVVDAAIGSVSSEESVEYPNIGHDGSSGSADIDDPDGTADSDDIMSNMIGNHCIMIPDREDAPDWYYERSAEKMSRPGDGGTESAYESADVVVSRSGSASRAGRGKSGIVDDGDTTVGESTSGEESVDPYPDEAEKSRTANEADSA